MVGSKKFEGLIVCSLQGSSGDESRPEAAAGEDETGEFNGSFEARMLMLIKPSGGARSRQRSVCVARPAPLKSC